MTSRSLRASSWISASLVVATSTIYVALIIRSWTLGIGWRWNVAGACLRRDWAVARGRRGIAWDDERCGHVALREEATDDDDQVEESGDARKHPWRDVCTDAPARSAIRGVAHRATQ